MIKRDSLRGRALAHYGQALAAIQATGQEAGRLLYLALVAEQYEQAGQVEAGLQGFTEGFDTADLREAKALLDKLGNKTVTHIRYGWHGDGTLMTWLSATSAQPEPVCPTPRPRDRVN